MADKVIVRELFDLTADDVKEFDAVVDAFGAWTEDALPKHSSTLNHLCDVLSSSQTRLMVVGGAGSLYINKEHTAQFQTVRILRIYLNPLWQQWQKPSQNFVRERMCTGPI